MITLVYNQYVDGRQFVCGVVQEGYKGELSSCGKKTEQTVVLRSGPSEGINYRVEMGICSFHRQQYEKGVKDDEV